MVEERRQVKFRLVFLARLLCSGAGVQDCVSWARAICSLQTGYLCGLFVLDNKLSTVTTDFSYYRAQKD